MTAAGPPAGGGDHCVPGVPCRAGHHNHIAARYCWMCGASMAVGPRIVVHGPRPVVGTVIDERNGARHALRTDAVIEAREPAWQPCFSPAGGIDPAALHARITFLGWSPVIVADAPGIALTLPGATTQILTPGSPTLLVSGTVVRIGSGSLLICLLDHAGAPEPASRSAPTGGRREARHRPRHARTPRHRR